MSVPRVVIVDDHTLLTEALRRLLEQECEVIATYDDPRAFLRDVARLRPDIVILDISMPTLNGLDAARELRRVLPSVRIIFLTMNEDADVAAEAPADLQADASPARSPAAARRGPLDEAGGGDSQRLTADGGLSQVPHDGAPSCAVDGGAHAFRRSRRPDLIAAPSGAAPSHTTPHERT